jgi:hypothetical protein
VANHERIFSRIECHFRSLPILGDDAADDFWGKIAPTFLKETVTGGEPKQRTWVKTAWDRQELRVLFWAEDDDAWASLTARDAPLYTEEVVEIFFDPFGDLESYFEIEVNPLNAVCDLMLRRVRSGYRKEFAWDCDGLRTAVKKSALEWSAELSIPFASLAPDLPVPNQPWRANFLRIDRPKNSARELSAWSPTERANFHVPERFGFLDFVP